jgi:transposase
MHDIQRIAPGVDLVKEETVYSILAKFCKIAGFPSTNETLKHVELTPYCQLDSDLPGFIPSIAKMVGISGQEILNNHCVINYFKAFSKREVFRAAEKSLLDGKSNDIHAKLSLIANRTGKHENLYYCLSCVKESFEKYGTAHWHREHQLPGVSACLIHRLELSDVVRCRKNTTLPPIKVHDEIPKTCSIKAELLASLSKNLLLGKLTEHLDQSKVTLAYRLRLRDLGFTTKKMRVRQRRLRAELLKFWGDVTENSAVTSVFSGKVIHPFPQNMFYRISAHHPLKHLLLIGFLFGDLAGFHHAYEKAEYQEEENIGMCDAKNAEMKAKLIRKQRAIALLRDGHSLRQTAQAMGVSVGYVKKVALSNHIPVKARPKKIYKTEIRTIWRKLYMGESTEKIAKQFSISVAAVEQILSAHPYLPELRTKIRFFTARKMHREKIQEHLTENSTTTRNRIRLELGASYSWLFKNDKIWLYENLPARITTSSTSKIGTIPEIPIVANILPA